jgi:hypothetical protein
MRWFVLAIGPAGDSSAWRKDDWNNASWRDSRKEKLRVRGPRARGASARRGSRQSRRDVSGCSRGKSRTRTTAIGPAEKTVTTRQTPLGIERHAAARRNGRVDLSQTAKNRRPGKPKEGGRRSRRPAFGPWTWVGARVGSHRSPILRPSNLILTRLNALPGDTPRKNTQASHLTLQALSGMTLAEMARELLRLANKIRLRRFQKHSRGPKKKPPKRSSPQRQPHVATARILVKRQQL